MQLLTRLAGAGALLAALALLLSPLHLPGIRRCFGALRAVDAVVTLALAGWIVIGPVFFDDGWSVVRQTNARSSGGFSNYYDTFGEILPLGTWFEWVAHWVNGYTTVAVVQRIPVTLVLLLTWFGARWCLAAVRGGHMRQGEGTWTLACAFLVGAFAWGMTLRPEPVLAVLVVASLACAITIAASGRLRRPLTAACVLFALAVTAHPAGLVAAAPILAVLPLIVRTVRRAGRLGVVTAAAAAACGTTTVVLLAFLDSDVSERRAQAATWSAAGEMHDSSWRDEIHRWTALSDNPSSMLRRAAATLMLLAVAGYATRRRRGRLRADIVTASLTIGLVLLTLTPSKWISHFGGLLGLATVAVAVEVNRLVDEARARVPGAATRIVCFAGAAALAAVFSWSPRKTWGTFDLTSLAWPTALGSDRVPYDRIALAGAVALLLGATAYAVAADGRRGLARIPEQGAAWVIPVVFVPILAFTVAVFVSDAARSDRWTFTRQNIESLAGRAGCGLGESMIVPEPGSARPLVEFAEIPAPPKRQDIVSYDGGSVRELGPADSVVRTGWFRVPRSAPRVGAQIFGWFRGGDTLSVEWGRTEGDGTVSTVTSGRSELSSQWFRFADSIWSVIPAAALPPRPPGTDAVRLSLTRGPELPLQLLGLGAPLAYRATTLGDALRARPGQALVPPDISQYLPCAKQPPVMRGAAGMPTVLVKSPVEGLFSLNDPTSPFAGVLDVAPARQLIPEDDLEGGVTLVEFRRHGVRSLSPQLRTGAG